MLAGRDTLFFTLGMMSFLRGGSVSEGCISGDGGDIVASVVCTATSSRCTVPALVCITVFVRCTETFWGCTIHFVQRSAMVQRAFLIVQGWFGLLRRACGMIRRAADSLPPLAQALLEEWHMNNHSISSQTKQFETAINNALKNSIIKAAVLPFGYTVAKLNAGKTLLTAAIASIDEATALAGEKQFATANVKDAFQTAKGAYQDLAKVARAIFQDQPAHLAALGLDKAMPRGMDAFALSAHTLFNSGEYTDPIREALEENGYDSTKLSPEGAKIAAFKDAREGQSTCIGNAQNAKSEQRKALKALRVWSMAFRKIARVALKDKPELLEVLGILHRSVKTKAQRSAPAKSAATRAKNTALKSGGTAKAA